VLLIDTREPPPPPKRGGGWWPGVIRALLPFAVALALLLVATHLAPVPSYLVTLAACVLIGLGASRLVPRSGGLREHRQ
jgi:hypothetical protein